jgi:uncharacterized protein (UPF0335 family)
MRTTSQQNNGERLPLENEQQSRRDVQDDSRLGELFRQFLALEADGKSVNKRKADLFVKAKADGYDPKALRTAFRQRVREMEYPEETTKHGELTDSYLVILRSEGSGDAGRSDSSPVSLAPADPARDALARSHAHTRTRESVSHNTDGGLISLADTKAIGVDSSDMDVVVDDDSDIPDSLRCSQVRCVSTADISMQAVETCE